MKPYLVTTPENSEVCSIVIANTAREAKKLADLGPDVRKKQAAFFPLGLFLTKSQEHPSEINFCEPQIATRLAKAGFRCSGHCCDQVDCPCIHPATPNQ